MSESERPWASDAFRGEVRLLAERIEQGDVEPAAMDLWRTTFAQANRWIFAEGLWNIWGGITDDFTHPRGDPVEGCRVAVEAAKGLQDALNDESRERKYCDEWAERICG